MTHMPTLVWTGDRVPAPVAAVFAAERIRLVGADRAPAHTPQIVFTPSARPPAGRADGVRWIWLSGQNVRESDRVKVVLRGAYDVIVATAPEAATALLARARELLETADSGVEVPPHIVAESDAARRMFAKAARVA